MPSLLAAEEGYVPFRGHRTWYRVVRAPEESGKLPLVCLHGGPGAPHDYLEPLEAMSAKGRGVVLYDQLGCGNSDLPKDSSTYSIALFLAELAAIRQALDLPRVHVLGHSWGGMLAMEYALTQPAGLASLVLADTAASVPEWVSEMRRLIAELPHEVQDTLVRHETLGTTNSPEYHEACRGFFRRHGSGRIEPRPDCLNRMADKPGDDVYHLMWGPSEWFVTGTLAGWDIMPRLREIHIPTLVVGGRFDHATPLLTERLHRGIPGSEWVTFENSGHFPHLEEAVHYLEVLSGFLDRVDAGA